MNEDDTEMFAAPGPQDETAWSVDDQGDADPTPKHTSVPEQGFAPLIEGTEDPTRPMSRTAGDPFARDPFATDPFTTDPFATDPFATDPALDATPASIPDPGRTSDEVLQAPASEDLIALARPDADESTTSIGGPWEDVAVESATSPSPQFEAPTTDLTVPIVAPIVVTVDPALDNPADQTSEFPAPGVDSEQTGEIERTSFPVQREPQRWGLIDWAACMVLAAIATLSVGLQIGVYPALAPDEVQHIDYAYSASRLEWPRVGETVGPVATASEITRGVETPEPLNPPFGQEEFAPSTATTKTHGAVALRPPLYYVVTGFLARSAVSLGVTDDFTTAARGIGILWLIAGWMTMWYVMSLLGIGRLQRSAIASVFIATPLLITTAATVGNDAAAFFAGAVVLVATIHRARKRNHWIWLIAAFAFASLLTSAVLPVQIVCLGFLLIDGLRDRDRSMATWLVPTTVMVGFLLLRWPVGGLIRQLFWPSDQTASIGQPLGPGESVKSGLLDQAVTTFFAIGHPSVPNFMATGWNRFVVNISNWLTIVLVGAAAMYGRPHGRVTLFARLTGVMSVAVVPTYAIAVAVVSGTRFVATGQFGLALLTSVIAVAAAGLFTRFATWVTLGVGVVVIMTETSLQLFG